MFPYRNCHVRDGELQEWSEMSGREEDRTSEVRDVQYVVPRTGNTEKTEGRGRKGVWQQRQNVPLLVSNVHGRVRHGYSDRDQGVGTVPRRRKG